jgi:hypothetical protein
MAEVAEALIAAARPAPAPVSPDAAAVEPAGAPAALPSPIREQLNALLERTVAPHRQFVGMALAYEPDAVDGRDAEHANLDALHDASGRYVPYFAHTASGLNGEVLVGYDQPGDGDYYQLPKQTRRESKPAARWCWSPTSTRSTARTC